MLIIDHQPISLQSGSRSAEAAVTAGTVFVIHLARKTTATPTLWADGVNVELHVNWSADGGTTWRDLVGAGMIGGIILDKLGNERAEDLTKVPIPETCNRVRVSVTITGGRFDSILTVETL